MCLFLVPIIEDIHLFKVILISCPSGGCVGKSQTILANTSLCTFPPFWMVCKHLGRNSTFPEAWRHVKAKKGTSLPSNPSKLTESSCELPGGRLYGLGKPRMKGKYFAEELLPNYAGSKA